MFLTNINFVTFSLASKANSYQIDTTFEVQSGADLELIWVRYTDFGEI